MTKHTKPLNGEKIENISGKLEIPDKPIIPFIIGDGIGPDIWRATQPVLDTATSIAYQNKRHLCWIEVPAGTSALEHHDSLLPSYTIDAFRDYFVGLKGPLSTPVGGGFRSLNVTLRRELDLYVCMRPIQWFVGSPSPIQHPERVDMIVFRENTEDIYAGIEFESDTNANQAFLEWLKGTFPEEFNKIRFPESSGIAIKPISRQGSQRFIRATINYALDHNRSKITLVHKGNIMKFTEGAFANWCYDLAEREFGEQVFTQRKFNHLCEMYGDEHARQRQAEAAQAGKLIINDVITDAAFEQTLTRPDEFDVIATTNLNGDYLSDALSAQVGGLGIAPGVNINADANIAIFEATHGTAPTLAGKNVANPSSLILSGALMLDHIGWHEAAELVRTGIRNTLQEQIFTQDFHRTASKAKRVSTTEFGQAVIHFMQTETGMGL